MNNKQGLASTSPKTKVARHPRGILESFASRLRKRIAVIGRTYQSGFGKYLNPWIEKRFPFPSKAFKGPGRFLGMYTICLVLYLILHAGEPAMALFLSDAQNYVSGLPFFTSTTQLVDVFFGVLRAAIVLIIGYFVLRIGLAYRQDEDWVRPVS